VDLQSPTSLVAAWVLVPLLVAIAAAGLGTGLARLAGLGLGALTLPAGLSVGIVVITTALELGLNGVAAAAVCGTLAVPGLILFGLARRGGGAAGWRPPPEALWATGCALGAYLIGMAPLIGSGRLGVLGYVLNNDPSVHVSAIELLREHGTVGADRASSSFHFVTALFDGHYPLGSYAWPLFGTVFGRAEAFSIWSPLIALTSALTALVVFAVMRELGGARIFAAAAGVVISSGYLPFSFLAQGGAKELSTALAVYLTIALFARAARDRISGRALLPTAVVAASAVNLLGLGALAWLAPAGAAGVLLMLWRPPASHSRLRVASALGICLAVALGAALTSILASLHYLQATEERLIDPAQTGNLLGPVPPWEVFNVWLGDDYRASAPAELGLTVLTIAVAAGLALAGPIDAFRRSRLAVPLALIAAAAGGALISQRYSIYFEAKAYMVAAPAVGMATAAGLLWLHRSTVRAELVAIAMGVLLAATVIASDALVYAGAWVTPRERFEELAAIANRFRGEGPMLVNEREEYAKYFLRDSRPWESWGAWQPDRGLRVDSMRFDVGHTPDFDDYTPAHMSRFRLLLERRRPGGSAPPGNFEPVSETPHYRVWRRIAPSPRAHLALGQQLDGSASLNCDEPQVAELLKTARATSTGLRIAKPRSLSVVSRPQRWHVEGNTGAAADPRFISWRGAVASTEPALSPGSYDAYIQGSFGPGVRLSINDRTIGETFGDLGLQDGWQRLGTVVAGASASKAVLRGLDKPWWQAGSKRSDVVGPLAFSPLARETEIVEVGARASSRLCGRELDWIELL